MPLTPSDVANKQFKVTFRGYSLDEVDAFLDEVESEIGRLLRENDALKSGAAAAPAAAAPAAVAEPEPAAPAERPLVSTEGQEAALRTLLLAQRTADEAVAEARAEAAQIVEAARAEAEATLSSARSEADTTLTDARAEAERLVTEAQSLAERTLAEAREEAETTLTSARSEAESTLTSARTQSAETLSAAQAEADRALAEAREAAARADAEIAAKVSASLGDLDERRALLERHIEDLRTFEREYRTRLKAYLQAQLSDLEDRGGSEDGGVGVPAGAPGDALGADQDDRGAVPSSSDTVGQPG